MEMEPIKLIGWGGEHRVMIFMLGIFNVVSHLEHWDRTLTAPFGLPGVKTYNWVSSVYLCYQSSLVDDLNQQFHIDIAKEGRERLETDSKN